MNTATTTHDRSNPVVSLAPIDDHDVGAGGPEFGQDDGMPKGNVVDELARLRRIVEVEHDRRFQRIESDLRWVIMLTTAQLVALIGGAIATFTLA